MEVYLDVILFYCTYKVSIKFCYMDELEQFVLSLAYQTDNCLA